MRVLQSWANKGRACSRVQISEGRREGIRKKRRESPHADEHVAVAEDEQQDVFLRHVVEVGVLLVGEEQIGLPQALEHFGVHCQRV